MSTFSLIVKFLITICLIGFEQVDGHGRLLTPIARTSLWRGKLNHLEQLTGQPSDLDPSCSAVVDSKLVPNYDDNQMFCGGFDVQYRQNSKIGFTQTAIEGGRLSEVGTARWKMWHLWRGLQQGKTL